MRFRMVASVLAVVLAGGLGVAGTSALARTGFEGAATGHNGTVLAGDGTAIGYGKDTDGTAIGLGKD